MPEFSEAQERSIHSQQRSPVRTHDLSLWTSTRFDTLRPLRILAPYDFPGRRIHAGQRGIRFVSAIKSVQVPIPVDRCIEMKRKFLRRPYHSVCEVWPHFNERASGAVAGRDEHFVVEHDRTGCIHGLVTAATPWK